MFLIKDFVFEITGQCKHSGNCCRSIMLYDDGVAIHHVKDWKKFISNNLVYERFKPNYDKQTIYDYDCSCLTIDNKCSEHSTRPSMCHHYPVSFFYDHGYIYESCGYNAVLDRQKLGYFFPKIKKEILSFYSVQSNESRY